MLPAKADCRVEGWAPFLGLTPQTIRLRRTAVRL